MLFVFVDLEVGERECGNDVFCVVGYFANDSNVAAGKLFGIPLRGTHSHAYVSSFMVSSLQPKVSIFMWRLHT